MSTSSTAFTGSSSFSSSLAQTVARAVSFAALPMQQLQNQQSALQGQQSEASTLTGNFKSLQNAITAINGSAGSNAYTASVDNTSIASATVSPGAFAGNYTVDVISTGSHTNTLSTTGLTTVTDPTTGNIDSSASYTLTVDSTTYTISNSAGTLSGLAQAINASGANVQATVVNVGSSSSPDYRLSVQGNQYSPSAIQLSDGTNNSILDTVSNGSYVQYEINGSSSTINSDSRTIQLSTGLSVGILQTGTATISVAQNTTGIEGALNSFVTAFNTATDELAKSRGQNGGALAGQSIVYQLSNALQSIGSYTGVSGKLQSLSDIGLTFDSNGHLQFDSSAFEKASSSSVSDVVNFFGTTSGTGFLASTNSVLTSISDPTSGILTGFSNGLSDEMTSLTAKIKVDQDHINSLQTTLTNQMATADATIASMEQQLDYVTNLFTSMQDAAKANNG